jgi:hypothetical protein
MDRVSKLRVVYGLALANLIILMLWTLLFDIPGVASAGLRPHWPFTGFIYAFGVFVFLIVAAPLGFLVRKPMGWGKLLLPLYALAWIMNSAIGALIMARFLHVVGLWVPAACGLVMLALTVAHQIIDPTFFRTTTS